MQGRTTEEEEREREKTKGRREGERGSWVGGKGENAELEKEDQEEIDDASFLFSLVDPFPDPGTLWPRSLEVPILSQLDA